MNNTKINFYLFYNPISQTKNQNSQVMFIFPLISQCKPVKDALGFMYVCVWWVWVSEREVKDRTQCLQRNHQYLTMLEYIKMTLKIIFCIE